MDALSTIKKYKIVAIARKISVEKIVQAAQALNDGGIHCLEITFNQASETCIADTTASITAVKKALGSTLCVGAGTVVTVEQTQAAAAAGADFILAPNTDVSVIEEVKRLGLIAVPGAFTPSEILTAWNAGADIVKLFPAGNLGIPYVKAIRGPINHIPLMAVGGVSIDTIRSFLDNSFCSCGIGSHIVRNDLIQENKFEELTALAKTFVQKLL